VPAFRALGGAPSPQDPIGGALFGSPRDETIDLVSHRFLTDRLVRIQDSGDASLLLASEQGAMLPPTRNRIGIGIGANDPIVVGRAQDRGVRLFLSTEEGGGRSCTRGGVKEAREKAGSSFACRRLVSLRSTELHFEGFSVC
jgi:hypothetical protein